MSNEFQAGSAVVGVRSRSGCSGGVLPAVAVVPSSPSGGKIGSDSKIQAITTVVRHAKYTYFLCRLLQNEPRLLLKKKRL